MIIEYAWITYKKVDLRLSNGRQSYKETKWRGLFLFGFIPLLIRVVSYEYGKREW
jgi:hypothetical protein